MTAARPVEIIGGGLAGLALGLALRRAGAEVGITEAGEYPRHRVCGEFIAGLDEDTVAQLRLRPLLAGALSHREVAWFFRDRLIRIHELPEPAFGISRHLLDARLADAFVAAGGTLRTGRRVATPGRHEGQIVAIGRRRGQSPWLGLKVHVRGLALERDLELHLGHDAYIGLSRVEDGWINVCGLFRRQPQPARATGSTGHPSNVLFGYMRACGFNLLGDRLAEAEIDRDSFCAVAALQFDRRMPPSGAIQVGDACAMIPPFTGNGMAMAFQSAAVVLPHVRGYACDGLPWSTAVNAANAALRRRFRWRLSTANFLHPFLLRAAGQRGLAWLSHARLLPFRALYGLLH